MNADVSHPFDRALAAELLAQHRADEQPVYAQARAAPVALYRLAQLERNLAAYAARDGQDALVPPALRLSGRATAALFACAFAAPEQPVHAPMRDDDVFVLRATRVGNLASYRPWIAGFHAALASHDVATLDRLAQVDTERLAGARGVISQRYVAAYAACLRDLWHQTGSRATRIDLALAEADPSAMPFDEAAWATHVDVPALRLMRAVAARDPHAIEEARDAALLAHRRYWSDPARAADPSGIIALPIAALLAHAAHLGVRVGGSSPYLPRTITDPRS